MNIENLEYILEIYNCKSINKAAKRLYISQPRLSLLVKKMEDEVGYRIFNRTNTGIAVTKQGEDFIHSASLVYQEYLKMKSNLLSPAKNANLAISVCYSSFFSAAYFGYKAACPSSLPVQDSFCEASPNQCLNDVVSHHSQLAVIYCSYADQDIFASYASKHGLIPIFTQGNFPIRAVSAVGHPLAKKEQIHLIDLLNYPFVTYNDLDFDMVHGRLGFTRETNLQYVSCRASFYDAIRRDGCISVSLDFAPGEDVRAECVCLPIADAKDYYLIAGYCHEDYRLNPREEGFIEYLKEQMNSLEQFPV